MTFSNELILGVTLGILITGLAIYLFIKIEPHHPIKKLIRRAYKWLAGDNYKAPPASKVKAGEMQFSKNLDKSTVHLDLKLVLEMLSEYQGSPTPELLLKLHEELEKHTPEGNNALHEYISHKDAEVEVVKEMLEIEPELLTEENAHGETALHESVKHDHEEITAHLMLHEHFDTHEQWHHFLHHHDHKGHTALHDAAHLWHYHPHHFLHMVEEHPVGSLLWQDKEGKTVYEHFFENKHADGAKLVEALIHKGVLHMHNGHLEIPHEMRQKILAEAGNKPHNLATLAELLVNHYSPLHQRAQTGQPTPGASPSQRNTNTGIHRTNRPHPE
jgi:hypothetical protein